MLLLSIFIISLLFLFDLKKSIKDVKIDSSFNKNEIRLETMNHNVTPKSSEETNTSSKALDFWDKEIERVNSVDLNVTFIKDSTYGGYNLTEIWFYSPNFVGKNNSLKLKGYILYPKNMTSKNPACLWMTGLGGIAGKALGFSSFYLERGFVVFTFDYPAHGESEGAEDPNLKYEWFFDEGKFNQMSQCYLTICSSIQALRVLESIEQVNKSQIFVTGVSYGGLNTMWLSSICVDRIAGAMPCMATGGAKDWHDYDKKNFILLLLKANKDFEGFLNHQNLFFDPIYYLKSKKLPPILFVLGSRDEIFPYVSINTTINSISHDGVFLSIHDIGHGYGIAHGGLSTAWNNFLNYTIFNGAKPFEFETKKINLSNNGIQIDVNSTKTVIDAKISYKITNVKDYSKKELSKWRVFPLVESDKNSWNNFFQMEVNVSELKNDDMIFAKINDFNFDYYIVFFFNDGSCFSTAILQSKMILTKSYDLEIFELWQMERGIYMLFVIVEIFIVLIIIDLSKKYKEFKEIELEELDKIEVI